MEKLQSNLSKCLGWRCDKDVTFLKNPCHIIRRDTFNFSFNIFQYNLIICISVKDVTKVMLLKLFLGFGAGPWSLVPWKAFKVIWSGYLLLLFSQILDSLSLNLTFSTPVTKTRIIWAKLKGMFFLQDSGRALSYGRLSWMLVSL